MSDEVVNAINQSKKALIMRPPSHPFVWNRLPLPDDVREFFTQAAGGTLLSARMNDGISFGFEIEPDALMMSINEYYGVPAGDLDLSHCDNCFVFAHHLCDPESASAIDLNPCTFGQIVACRLTMDEHPQHGAVVVAKSFSEWLQFWMNNLHKADGDWRKLAKEPQLALLND